MNRNDNEAFDFVRTAVMVFAVTCLVLICAYFVISAFNDGGAAGLRSAAGVFLPFVLGGFLAIFNRKLFEKAAIVRPSVAFTIALAFGVVVMLLIRHIDWFETAPVAELVVASGLTLFLYAPGAVVGTVSAAEHRDVWLAYYFGVVSGMLGYVVLMGFPFARGA